MTKRKRMHGRKRRSPSPARFSVALTNPYEKLSNNQPGKPIGEDQTNYDPDAQQKNFALQLEAARLKASMDLDRQREEYEGLSSRGSKGSGAHTHSSKGSGNVLKQPDLIKTTGSQAEGTGIQSLYSGLQQKMQNIDWSQAQFQTANTSPFVKKTGFKMKRKK